MQLVHAVDILSPTTRWVNWWQVGRPWLIAFSFKPVCTFTIVRALIEGLCSRINHTSHSAAVPNPPGWTVSRMTSIFLADNFPAPAHLTHLIQQVGDNQGEESDPEGYGRPHPSLPKAGGSVEGHTMDILTAGKIFFWKKKRHPKKRSGCAHSIYCLVDERSL